MLHLTYNVNITKEDMLSAVPYLDLYGPSEFSNLILDLRYYGIKN